MTRVQRLAELLDEHLLDAALVTSESAIGYLVGLFEDAHERFLALAVRPDGNYALIAPQLTATQAERAGISPIRPWSDGEDPYAVFSSLAEEWELRTGVLRVDPEMRADHLLALQERLPAAHFGSAAALLDTLMSVKDESEVEALRRAGAVVDDVYGEFPGMLRAGMSERELERHLREAISERGARPTFCIVAFGEGSAEPHHVNGDRKLGSGDLVLVDFGCELERYQADITRCVVAGSGSEHMHATYSAVWGAHESARVRVRPGVPCGEVDRAARETLERHGMADAFVHRLGHGIGLRGHEAPYLSPGSAIPLAAGHAFSIEPGVYFPGDFGIRLENIYVCRDEGAQSMNRYLDSTLVEIPV